MSLVGLPGSDGFSPEHDQEVNHDATRLTTLDPLQAGQAMKASLRVLMKFRVLMK